MSSRSTFLSDAPAGGWTVESDLAAARLRILHVLAPAEYGGLEQVVRALAHQQVLVGHEVAVAAVLGERAVTHPFLHGMSARGVMLFPLRLPGRAYRRERTLVKEISASFGADVIHTHGYRADVLHHSWARKAGIPVVTTVHGFTGGGWKNRIYERVQRRAHRSHDGIVAVSKPLHAELTRSGVSPHRVHCVPNAWVGDAPILSRGEAREALGVEQKVLLVGFVGRLSREKGADVFIDAISRLRSNAVGAVMGDGDLRAGLEDRARSLGIGDRTRWFGAVRGAGQYMKAFDAFVMSSRTEGTPIALFEALAAAVPVVATRVGGVPDVVTEREAVLVEADDPGAVAAAIDEVLAEPTSALERAERGVVRLRTEFDPGRWIARYDDVYRQSGAVAVRSA